MLGLRHNEHLGFKVLVVHETEGASGEHRGTELRLRTTAQQFENEWILKDVAPA